MRWVFLFPFGPCGILRAPLAHHGSSWLRLEAPGLPLAPPCSSWLDPASLGSSWLHLSFLVSPCTVWLCLSPASLLCSFCSSWLLLASPGSSRSWTFVSPPWLPWRFLVCFGVAWHLLAATGAHWAPPDFEGVQLRQMRYFSIPV